MRKAMAAIGVAVGAAAGIVAVRRRRSGGDEPAATADVAAWQTITINRAPEEVAPMASPPWPIRDLVDTSEWRVSAAPGGGTELSLRPRPGGRRRAGLAARLGRSDRLEEEDLAEALLRAKRLLETSAGGRSGEGAAAA